MVIINIIIFTQFHNRQEQGNQCRMQILVNRIVNTRTIVYSVHDTDCVKVIVLL